MRRNKNILLIAIMIIVSVFFWELFLTYGMPFFWEDYDYLHLHQIQDTPSWAPARNMQETLKGLAKEFVAPAQLFRAGFSSDFSDRPYQHLVNNFLSNIFSDKIILYRAFRALIIALYAGLLFFLISEVSVYLGILAVTVYATSPEVWAAAAVTCDTAIASQLAILIAVWLFIRLLKKSGISFKDPQLWGSYALIFILSQYSVLSKCDGRYLAAIFFTFLLIMRRRQLKYHLPALALLFIFEVPVLGLIKNIFSRPFISPISFSGHNGFPLVQSLRLIIKNYVYPLTTIGKFTVTLLVLASIIHLVCILFLKRKKAELKKDPELLKIRERILLFFIFFAANFVIMALARSFNYGYIDSLMMVDCSFFIAPFLLFLCYYLFLVNKYLGPFYRKKFAILCILLIVVEAVIFRLPRLNRFRGGWGNYFCAWANAEKYINNLSKNALALSINRMHYAPFTFHNSTNRVRNTFPPAEASPFTDTAFIEKQFKEGGYTDVFVIHDNEINFRGNSVNVKMCDFDVIDGNSGDLYDRFKSLIGRGSKSFIWIYQFKPKDKC